MNNDIIRIEKVDGGFWQYFDHPLVDRIWCGYDTGDCCVYYHDHCRELHIGCEGYLFQYGTPVSNDGKLLFMGSWYKGLYCYIIETGKLLWHMKSTRITKVIVYDSYLTVARYGYYLAKIDIATGEIIAKINSKGLEAQYKLDHRVCAKYLKRKLCIVNTETMQIEKAFPYSALHPNSQYDFLIKSVRLEDNKIIIHGSEGNNTIEIHEGFLISPMKAYCLEIPL